MKVRLPKGCDPKNESWNQAETLTPLPFPKSFHWSTLVDGLDRGDTLTSQLSSEELQSVHRTGFLEAVSAAPVPSWVDRDSVRRGQALHMKHFYCFLTSLCSGLLVC
jgi:hypothetical protein